jgi:hypothetical protein
LANYLLQSVAIEDMRRAGCDYYHMGESSPSIAEFKRAFGALSEQYVEYRLERLPLTPMSRHISTARRKVEEHLCDRRTRVSIPHSVSAAAAREG